MIAKFADDIWTVDGPDVPSMGFRFPTRMAVLKLSGDDLFIWSPIALTEELRHAVDEIGRVRCLVAPNSLHHLYLLEWKDAYPEADIYAAPGLQKRRPDLPLNGELGRAPASIWSDRIDQVVVRGNVITTEVVFFHRSSATVLFTDLLQNYEPGWFTGWQGLIARLDLLIGARPRVPRKFRVGFIDRGAARESVHSILTWPAKNVLMAHGTPVVGGGADYIKDAFAWLLKGQ